MLKRYREAPEKSAELLRLALPMMSKQDSGVHPISYAVWYEYVGGFNAALREEIDSLTKDGRKLDDETTRRLYAKYIAELDADTVSRLGDSLRRVMTEVTDTTSVAGNEAGTYGETLERLGQKLEGAPAVTGELPGMIQAAFLDTVQMRTTMTSVQERMVAGQKEVDELRKELVRVREEAMVDALTGLLNRRAFDERIIGLISASEGKGETFSIVMVDIDHFKKINDGYGHLFGDRVIRAVGEALKASVKGRDSVARFGGEEFAVLLPQTALKGAWAVAEGMRRMVAASRIRRLNNDEVVGNITMSAGVALHAAGESAQSLLERADAALYRAKRGGRNRVETAE